MMQPAVPSSTGSTGESQTTASGSSEKVSARKRPSLYIGLILLLGIVVRLIYLLQVAEYPNFKIPYAGLDAAVFHDLAKRVAGGDLLLGKEVYYFSPLYPYVLGAIYALFGDSPWTARLFNITLGTGTIFLIYLYSRRFFKSAAVALIAALGAALYGPYLVFDTSALKTTLGMFLLALSFYLMSRAQEKEAVLTWLPVGLVLGMALTLSGQLTLFIFGLAIWLMVKDPHQGNDASRLSVQPLLKRRIARIACLTAGLILALAPFTIRNYIVAKDFVLHSCVDGIHFYIGNHEGSWGGYTRVPGIRPNAAGHFFDARRYVQGGSGIDIKASQVSKFWRNRAMAFIQRKPGAFLRLCLKKAGLLLSPYEIPNNENYQYLTKISPYLSLFIPIGFLMPLALSGMLVSFFRPGRPLLLYIFFFSQGLALILTFVTWRYRLPLTLALWPLAGLYLVTTARWVQEKRSIKIAIAIFLILGSWAAGLSTPIGGGRREKDIKQAEMEMASCNLEANLLRQIETGTARSRRDLSFLWLQLARLRQSRYDLEGAVGILQRASAEYPKDPRLLRALADALARLGDDDKAREARKRWIREQVVPK